MPAPRDVKLADERLRDSCVWADAATKTYYLVSAGQRGPNGRRTVVQYTSKDLETWNGPRVIFADSGKFLDPARHLERRNCTLTKRKFSPFSHVRQR